MSIGTLSELTNTFESWINRDDLSGEVPGFITLIEADLKRRVRLRALKTENTAYSISAATVALPTDCREIINLTHEDGYSIDMVGVEELLLAGTYNGKPTRYYVLDDDTIRVSPTPDQAYTCKIRYYAKLSPLVADTDTNAILTEAPDIYLHGLLAHAAAFIEEDERAAKHLSLYEAGRDAQQAADVKSRYSGPLAPQLRHVV